MTSNLAGDPLTDFSVKLPAAIMSCAAEYDAFAGAIIPVFFDTMKEEYENKEYWEKSSIHSKDETKFTTELSKRESQFPKCYSH